MRRWFAKGWGSVVELLPLAAKIQLLNDGLVTFEVFAFQVIEQLSSFRRHHEQAPSGMEILSVGLQVLGQVVDPLRQQRNLDIRRTSVRLMKAISFYCVGLLFHSFQSLLPLFSPRKGGGTYLQKPRCKAI